MILGVNSDEDMNVVIHPVGRGKSEGVINACSFDYTLTFSESRGNFFIEENFRSG